MIVPTWNSSSLTCTPYRIICVFIGWFTDAVLMKIAKKIGHEQLQLSVFLGVENEEFEQLQQKHPKEPVYVSFEMLKVCKCQCLYIAWVYIYIYIYIYIVLVAILRLI